MAAAIAPTLKHSESVSGQTLPHHEMSHNANISPEENLWTELYYSLPYGQCVFEKCGCQRFRIHPSSFQPDQPELSQACNGCNHDHSFHALGSESDKSYGLKTRRNHWSYIGLLKKKSTSSASATDQNAASIAESVALRQDVAPQSILEIIQSMKATIDESIRTRQTAEIAPGRLSPESMSPPPPQRETADQRRQPSVEEPVFAEIDTQPEQETVEVQPENVRSSEPGLNSEGRSPLHVPFADESKQDEQALPPPDKISETVQDDEVIEEIAALSAPAGPSAPESHDQSEPEIVPEPEPEPPQQLQSERSAPPVATSALPAPSHIHQDSAQTVEPFDITQMSSPIEPPIGYGEDIEPIEYLQSRESSPTPPLAVIEASLRRLRNDPRAAARAAPPENNFKEPADVKPAETKARSEQTTSTESSHPTATRPEISIQEKSIQSTVDSSREDYDTTGAISSILPKDDWESNSGAQGYHDSARAQDWNEDSGYRQHHERIDTRKGCFYCNQPGHFKRECPEYLGTSRSRLDSPQAPAYSERCGVCRMSGHTTDECPGMERTTFMATSRTGSRASRRSNQNEPQTDDLSKAGFQESRHAPASTAPLSVPPSEPKPKPAPEPAPAPSESTTPVPPPAEPPRAETPRGRQTARSSQSSKTISSRTKEPELQIWADESAQPQVKADDGTVQYVPWWDQETEKGEAANDGWGTLPAAGSESFINEKAQIPDWSSENHGPNWARDQARSGIQHGPDSWGNPSDSWADEVEDIQARGPPPRANAWGEPPVWDESRGKGNYSSARRGRGRGGGGGGGGGFNNENNNNWGGDDGHHRHSGHDRAESGSSGNTARPWRRAAPGSQAKREQGNNSHAEASVATGASASGAGEEGVGAEPVVAEGAAGVRRSRDRAGWRASMSGDENRSDTSSVNSKGWKQVKQTPWGQGSAATHQKRDQRRRQRERREAAAAEHAKALNSAGNEYDDSQSRVKTTSFADQMAGIKFDEKDTTPASPPSATQSENLIEL